MESDGQSSSDPPVAGKEDSGLHSETMAFLETAFGRLHHLSSARNGWRSFHGPLMLVLILPPLISPFSLSSTPHLRRIRRFSPMTGSLLSSRGMHRMLWDLSRFCWESYRPGDQSLRRRQFRQCRPLYAALAIALPTCQWRGGSPSCNTSTLSCF